MNYKIATTALLCAALGLSGCGLFKKKTSDGAAAGAGGVTEYPGAPETSPAPSANPLPGGPVQIGGDAPGFGGSGGVTGADGATLGDVIYFEYDSTSLTPEGQALVVQYARYLSANPASKLRLEGNTDERGTREYNIGLGERRALAVEDGLIAQGASAGQLSVISYGEERPVDPEQSEAAYAKNRRVQLIKQ